ncbi:hypothetical protein SAMN05421770_101325 [Granulicella rosea]|uniref:Uncharacterized protein n=1 Tax=Granulicella rosea TaxID=474952 RepID=A0A239D784_9BACT|nr:Trm112 family protein [Granulicella rosea]SNS28137.1 hypothetical protein SAMN05421770_101325 [Granulicella rosea]
MQLTQSHLDLLVCPVCRGALVLRAGAVDCLVCDRSYPVEDGLPILLAARALQPDSSKSVSGTS